MGENELGPQTAGRTGIGTLEQLQEPFKFITGPIERIGTAALWLTDINTRPARRRINRAYMNARRGAEELLGVFAIPQKSTRNAEQKLAEYNDIHSMLDTFEEHLDDKLQAHLYATGTADYRRKVIDESNAEEAMLLGNTICLRAVELLRDPTQDWESTEATLEKVRVVFEVMPPGFYRKLGLEVDDIKLLEEHYSLPPLE